MWPMGYTPTMLPREVFSQLRADDKLGGSRFLDVSAPDHPVGCRKALK